MLIQEIIVEHSNFGITGEKKLELTVFFSDIIKLALIDMNIQGKDRISTYSLAKRLSGILIPNLYHLRNIVKGKDKYFETKLYRLMLPYIKASVKSVITDHPNTTSVFMNSIFINSFMSKLSDQKEALAQRIFTLYGPVVQ